MRKTLARRSGTGSSGSFFFLGVFGFFVGVVVVIATCSPVRSTTSVGLDGAVEVSSCFLRADLTGVFVLTSLAVRLFDGFVDRGVDALASSVLSRDVDVPVAAILSAAGKSCRREDGVALNKIRSMRRFACLGCLHCLARPRIDNNRDDIEASTPST